MKHQALRAVAHNIAHSLASGMSHVTGFYGLDIFGVAANSPGGTLRLDLLAGKVLEGDADEGLLAALVRIPAAFADRCQRAGGSWEELRRVEATFSGSGTNVGFVLEIEDAKGRCSTSAYKGTEFQRVRARDDRGRWVRAPALP